MNSECNIIMRGYTFSDESIYVLISLYMIFVYDKDKGFMQQTLRLTLY